MATTQENNSGLYFVVGGLVVAVMAFAAFYYTGALNSIEPAAGPSVIERNNTIVERAAPTPAPEQRSTTTSVDVGGNGVSATTTTTNDQ